MRIKNTLWGRFIPYLYGYWKLQLVIIVLGLVAIPFALLNPYLAKQIIDKAYAGRDIRLFFMLAVMGGLVFMVTALINTLGEYFLMRINRQICLKMSNDIFKHLQRLSLDFFHARSASEHIYKIHNDVNIVSAFLCNILPQTIILSVRLLCIFAVIAYLNHKFAFLIIFLIPVSCIQPYFFRKLFKRTTLMTIEVSQRMFGYLCEVFNHINLVKAFGKEKYEIRRFETVGLERLRMELKRDKLLSLSAFSGSMLNKIISGILVFYGGCQVMTGAMTIGSFSAIMMYLMQLTGLCRLLARLYENIANSAVSAARLLEMLNTAPKILDGTQALHHRITQGGIDFKDVSFGYKENSLILKNMNFSITPGSKIAITGLSGCGKTTLLSLILRMYDVTSGAIFVDGVDVRGVSREALTSSIAIVLQEPFLWNDTIADNIVYGLEHVTAQHVVEAAKIAEIHDFIVSLEDGYDSPIGEMACLLSEGQKQRLAIARALIRKPTILLFDEAFSSIDSETENRIIDNINTYFKNTTVMIVSHRISTVQRMESVYFFKNNSCIIKSGHNDLIRNNAAYKELFLGQCV